MYTNKTHQLFDLQTPCLLCVALFSQPTGKNSTVILWYVHGCRALAYSSCLLINKQANPIGSLFS